MVRTNNSYLADKVALRCNHLPSDDQIRVLDCYGGAGLIWSAVRKLSNRDIAVLPIDVMDYGDFRLPGDNRSYLSSIDLARFNVVDLDAYGIPADQLATLFDRGFSGVVFVTFIQSVVGAIPHRILTDIGFSKTMIRKSPAVFSCRGWYYFLDWLALNGVDRIWHRSKARKHYLVFNLGSDIS